MPNKSNISVIILSAGFSSRMKQAKFSLMFDKKKTFLEKIINEYVTFGCKEIIVVMNSEGIKLKDKLKLEIPKNVKFILNKHPEYERFFSLQIGMQALKSCNCVFVQSVDNPFITQNILSSILEDVDKADYIIPQVKDRGGHPILVSKKIINSIKKEENYTIILKEHLKQFKKYYTQIKDENILLNINTMEIYNRIFTNGNI